MTISVFNAIGATVTAKTLDDVVGTAGTANTNPLTVQGIAGGTPQPVSGTFWQTTQPVSLAASPLPTGASTEATLASFATATHTDLIAATPAGSNIIGKVGIDQTTSGTTNFVVVGNTNGAFGAGATNADAVTTSSGLNFAMNTRGYAYVFNGTTYDRAKKPNAVSRIVSSAATTNATVGKASAADMFGFDAYNTSATVKYLKIYNKATAPTVGTDTPIMTIALAPTSRTAMTFSNPQYFGTGLSYALTGAAADADTTALALGDVVALNINFQ